MGTLRAKVCSRLIWRECNKLRQQNVQSLKRNCRRHAGMQLNGLASKLTLSGCVHLRLLSGSGWRKSSRKHVRKLHRRRLEAELEQARIQASEHGKLQAELKRVQAEADEYKQKLSTETSTLRGEHEKTRAEHLELQLERERNAGVLEGRVDAMSAEADTLRQRVAD